jgi:hypothetical protein
MSLVNSLVGNVAYFSIYSVSLSNARNFTRQWWSTG